MKSIFDLPSPPKPQAPAVVNLFTAAAPSSILSSYTPPVPKPVVGTLFASQTVRKRIHASIDELKKFNQDEKILKAAQSLIAQTNVDDLKIDYVLTIGASIQEKHMSIAEQLLKLTISDSIKAINNVLIETVSCISNVRYNNAQREKTWLSKLVNNEERELRKFVESKQQIMDRVMTLRDSIKDVQSHINDAGKLKGEISQLILDLEPVTIQCGFYSEYVKDDFPNELFISRYSSLLSTKGNLVANRMQVNSLCDGFINLNDGINQVVLADIPMWLSNCTTSNTSDTTKDNIINNLKNLIK